MPLPKRGVKVTPVNEDWHANSHGEGNYCCYRNLPSRRHTNLIFARIPQALKYRDCTHNPRINRRLSVRDARAAQKLLRFYYSSWFQQGRLESEASYLSVGYSKESEILVPGGGVEPPRAGARRILSRIAATPKPPLFQQLQGLRKSGRCAR